MKVFVLVLTVAVGLVRSAAADDGRFALHDGNDLLRGIRQAKSALLRDPQSEDERQHVLQVLGYFQGALGQAVLWSKIDKACPFELPEDGQVTVEQTMTVTEKYLKDRPELLHETPELLTMLALKAAFPRT